MVRDERFEGRILRSDQPRGWANVAIDATSSILRFCSPCSNDNVI